MNLKLRKIDTIIIILLIIIASVFLIRAQYISIDDIPDIEPDNSEEEEIVVPPPPPPPVPPESLIPGFMTAVSPEDEGLHFDKIKTSREWWYWSAIFTDEKSDLYGWTVVISFNHMARTDLLGTRKPDMLVLTLHSPEGDEYGGLINKKRGLGIINQPALQAKSPGVSLEFDKSWAEGEAPNWHVHVEDEDIDENHDIIVDLDFFAPGSPLWTVGENALDKSNSNIANYMFMGCNVSGKIKIDGKNYHVAGQGFHEHSWSPNIVNKASVNGWDWCHMTMDNGWNIYLSNFYPTPQFLTSKSQKKNPLGTMVITTDQGKTITILDDVDVQISQSDKIFPFVHMPESLELSAKPSKLQPLLTTLDMNLKLDITQDNTYEKIWKFPAYVGMKIGRTQVSGSISWSDEDGDYELDLNGIGAVWSMRALL